MSFQLGYYGAKLIASFEFPHGIQTRPERDALGIPTIMGMIELPDGRKVTMDMEFSIPEIVKLYGERKKEFIDCVNESVRIDINQHQFDALVAMAFNVGVEAFSDEPNNTVLRMTNQGEFENAAAAFGKWTYGTLHGGKPGPDGEPARGPKIVYSNGQQIELDGGPMDKGQKWKKAFGGLYRRHVSEALLFCSLDWERAAHPDNIQLTKRTEQRPFGFYDVVRFKTPWKKIKEDAKYDTLPDMDDEDDVFEDEPITKMERLQYESAKAVGAEDTLEEYVAHRRGVAITPLSKKVPVEAVDYLDAKDKEPGNITVKRIEDSRRGKGFAKSEIGKVAGVGGVGVLAAEQVGIVEPVVKFAEKYSWNTIVWVAMILLILGVILHYYGKWEREEGEDGAEDLLG